MIDLTFHTGLGIAAAGFIAVEAALWVKRSRSFHDAHALLRRAKQEVQEISQLPLNNPNPLIQITESGRLIFANTAALSLFKGVEQYGFELPVLNGIQDIKAREISIDGKIYQQNIATSKVDGEKAYVVYCHDITDRKNYETRLQAAHKRAETMREAAEDAKEARGEFLANMSHELRTPMNGIIGLSDILVESGLGGEKQDWIEAVNSSAHSLLILLNDILDFSKIEAGELTMEKIPFDVRKVVRQIEALQNPMATQKGLVMNSHIAENVPRFLVGDPSRLQQILNNLISNALKFTEEGSVTLSVFGDEDGQGNFITNIAVKDTGIGIAKDKQAAVFEKFQQADASTARKYGGTGLGLAITKDLAELMNGVIAIESEAGVGTTFTVSITAPIAENQPEDVSEGVSDSGAGINIAAKLMIVDDHPINLMFLRKILTQIGFTDFDEATSGKQALALFEAQPYDLIIMDCQMPEMDGFEATRKIREIEQADSAPIIIAATADAMKGAEEKCMDAGMDDYISKPVDKDKMLGIIQRWIPGNEHEILESLKAEEAVMNAQGGCAAALDVLDVSRLEEFTGGDSAAEMEILTLFIDHLQSDISGLQKSFDEEDYEEWDSWVHKLYGACSHVGANALAAICDEGQSLSGQGTEDIHRIHPIILREYQHVQSALEGRYQKVA